MMDNFNRQVLRVAVAQICQSMGWDALQKSTHDTLTDVMQRYLEEIGKVTYGYTQLCNRTKPNLDDLHLAFQDTGVAVHELENYAAQVDPVQFIHPFTTYPRCKPCRLQHPSKGEIVDRADFYSEHLPPLPKVCEEPKDEIEENPSEEYSKALDNDESEKIKTSPLKELNHVLEMSPNVSVKRPHDAPMFLPQSKRVRPLIPANLNFEKKENLENTDGESLSPATPVSPYLPQEIPKVPDEPAKEAVKVKDEPKKPSSFVKEMVLPLKKLTPPDEKKAKQETCSPKKPKIKTEKSASPKVMKKLPTSSPRADSPSPKVKTEKLSPQKLKSPVKSRSPAVEKPAVAAKNVSEKSCKKQKSPLTSPVKDSPLRKKQPSVGARKESDSPVVGKAREDKHPKKKKAKAPDETDAAKSTRQDVATSEGLSTPKLTIKLLSKAGARAESTKSIPGESKSSVSQKKAPNTPESKKVKVKVKVKASPSENIAEPVGKLKISNSLLEVGVKKEHGKKKKKKKDKGRGKFKILKIEKTEPPIPKIRFKLDPSGESKVVETKPSVGPKIVISSGQESSKQSSLRIETEKVSRSIITETLSTTVDYDPSKAYFCPVCKRQDDGSPMVGCDGCDEWCHWACVGLIAAPPEDEKWYCPQCLLSRGTTKKSKTKKRNLKD